MLSPVLLIVFNRPETTRLVFNAIRAARPPRLYIAADGPRPQSEGDAQRCALVRQIATSVDWACEVRTRFRESNLGCKAGPYDAITWFFEQEEFGVILEDDVLPVPTFFDFCDELLIRYRTDDQVAMISGSNFVSDQTHTSASYIFSRYTHIWGWASWRRAWRYYDLTMEDWPKWRDGDHLGKMAGANRRFESYWRNIFDSVYSGHLSTCWDYQWTFACWKRGTLTILPKFNQTHNLGFGLDGTHTIMAAPAFVRNSDPAPLVFPLIHPAVMEQDLEADAAIDSDVFDINAWSTLKRRLKKIGFLNRWAASLRSSLARPSAS